MRYFCARRLQPRPALEQRAAQLLPALLLARVDGKSPVEYITRSRTVNVCARWQCR